MQMVVEIVHAVHIAHAVATRGQEFFADQYLVEHAGRTLVDMRVRHILFQRGVALLVISIEQCHVTGRAVIGDLVRGADELGGHTVGCVVEIPHHHQWHGGVVQHIDD